MSLKLTGIERTALTAEMRRIGSLGGKARARNLSSERRREIALKGVKTKAAKLASGFCAGGYTMNADPNAKAEIGSAPPGYVRPMTHAQLKRSVENAPEDIIETFISARNVDALIGDSGLGKTPFATQLGLCVAAGIPFLGMRTHRAVVLYVDYENGGRPYANLLDRLAQFLGLPKVPDNFRHMQDGAKRNVQYAIKELHAEFPDLPIVVILDTMRGYDPKMEGKNENASDEIAKLRDTARRHNASVLLIHHIRKHGTDKEGEQNTLPLQTTDTMRWLEQASGASALITQSTIRIGFDMAPAGAEAERVMKGRTKLTGEFGPITLKRVLDEEGEAIGWARVSGVHLIPQTDGQRDGFVAFADEFTFKQVKEKAGNPKKASEWIKAWRGYGVCEKIGKMKSKNSYYVKTDAGKKVPSSAKAAAAQKNDAAPKNDRLTPELLRFIVQSWPNTESKSDFPICRYGRGPRLKAGCPRRRANIGNLRRSAPG
jgi:hypothetical protein